MREVGISSLTECSIFGEFWPAKQGGRFGPDGRIGGEGGSVS